MTLEEAKDNLSGAISQILEANREITGQDLSGLDVIKGIIRVPRA